MFDSERAEYIPDVWIHAPTLEDMASVYPLPVEKQTAMMIYLCVRDDKGKRIFASPSKAAKISAAHATGMAELIEKLCEAPTLTPLGLPHMPTPNAEV